MSIEVNNNCAALVQTQGTTVSSVGQNDNKKVTTEEYFKKLCEGYVGYNLKLGNSFANEDNQVKFNYSPEFVEKAKNDPKCEKRLKELMAQVPDAVSFIKAHSVFPSGKKVKSVSYVIDRNGEVHLNVEYEEPKTKKEEEEDKKTKEKKRVEKKKKQKQIDKKKNSKAGSVCNYYNKVNDGYLYGNSSTDFTNEFVNCFSNIR